MQKLRVAHTPDADDAFMFYAMVTGKIDVPFEIEHVIKDIETLNKLAFEGQLDVTAISVHAYAYLSRDYRILSAGASVGDGYGPIVVSKDERSEKNLGKIAVPGKLTTAYLLLSLASDDFDPIEMKFDEIIPAVKSGKVDSGLLIHEGQITYKEHGLLKVLDLWEWWCDTLGEKKPLPLGINVISRKLDEETQKAFLEAMKESIEYALNNPEEAVSYAMKYSRGLSKELTEKFAKMYVNEYTYEMPKSVVESMEILFDMAEKKDLLKKPKLDIIF